MEAEGDIISNFIESSIVKCGGAIISDAIMHSDVIAQSDITVFGKRGLIVGGTVRSTTKISTKTAGSTMGTATVLEVGLDPTVLDRIHGIEKDMEVLSDEKEKVLQNIQILQKRFKAQGRLDEEKLKFLKQNNERLEEIEQIMDDQTEEYERLNDELERYKDSGKIIVDDKAYPGVKLTISNISTFIHTVTQHSAFVREGADIRIRSI